MLMDQKIENLGLIYFVLRSHSNLLLYFMVIFTLEVD